MLGCNSKNQKLQGLWIGKYSVHHPDTQDESIGDGQRRLLNFENDQLAIKNFHFDFLTDINDTDIVDYETQNDKIILIGEDRVDTINYSFSERKLLLANTQDNPRQSFFEKLPRTELATRESEFKELLLSSSFEIFDSIRIEFKYDGRLIIPNYDFHVGDNQLWMVDEYERELFLVVDGLFGFLLHVNEFDNDGFRGTIYGNKNREVFFKKLPLELKFEVKNLMGEWIEFRAKNISVPPPPIILQEERDYFEREQLLITDSTLRKSIFFRVDTMKWETNREQDLIILPNLDLPIRQKKWKIISLSEDELIIERIQRIRDVNGNQIERKVFERK